MITLDLRETYRLLEMVQDKTDPHPRNCDCEYCRILAKVEAERARQEKQWRAHQDLLNIECAK